MLLLGVTAAAPSPGPAASEVPPATPGGTDQPVATDGTDLVEPAALGRVVAGVLTDLDDALRTIGCRPPLELSPVLGCARDAGDGLVEVHGPDGVVSTTHGPDLAPGAVAPPTGSDPQHHHVEEDAVAAARSARSLPERRRPVVCAPDGSARTVVLYAHLRGQRDRLGAHRSTIEATVERSNELFARSGRASGGPELDLRVRCGASGQVAVSSVVVPSRNFGDIKAAVAAAGYDHAHEKYLIFGDFRAEDPRYAGIADLFLDERRVETNLNNGRRAMYGLVFGEEHFTGPTAIHELAHTMGAVQRGAPHADGLGHCSVGEDALCYPTTTTRCTTLVLDCGNDTYLSTATRTGQYLHAHWNLGWEGNRFVHVAGRSTAGPTFRDTGGNPHREAIEAVAREGIAGGFSDGTYRPSLPVTRAHMAAFLSRARDLTPTTRHGFRDVVGHPHEGAVGAVATARVANGYGDGTYRPVPAVTRGQMAAFLTRAFDLPPAGQPRSRDSRGTTHAEAIASVEAAGVAQGFGDGTFRPNDPVSRGQMATFLWRALER